ncbi:hypothetical protein LEP1GSC035_0301 [Leptospira noguchii str. 2007001578]|uniref:Uncharacterized protein n=1 Tax=Leptospira noguchii str. 2007001578 TaxID=1049974 RepID=A0ABP2TAE6_9LEPT|nr:hypothetical protein LEP1GSC035_0301 [Leptospira noguchii str. 2007001578]
MTTLRITVTSTMMGRIKDQESTQPNWKSTNMSIFKTEMVPQRI